MDIGEQPNRQPEIRRRNLQDIKTNACLETSRERDNGNDNLENDMIDKRNGFERSADGYLWLAIGLFFILLLVFVQLMGSSCTGLSFFPRQGLFEQNSDKYSPSFRCKSAQEHLIHLTSFGPRVVGSRANEAFAPKFLMDELKKLSFPVYHLPENSTELEFFQVDNGTFSLSMSIIGRFASVYRNIGSVVHRIRGQKWFRNRTEKSNALLINCHYDSVVLSPGAGDNAVSCAVQIEVTRAVLANAGKDGKGLPEHDLIFLYNGAEENMLQASHAFITQHRWAKDIRAFINLDSAGSGGREIVFQTGPQHPWLIWEYAKYAPHPFASIIGQDLFQGGLIPSDTDFRIFRDYGKIPGMDIAYIKNGYVYHTEFDTADRISLDCIQRAGENLLSLVRGLGNSKYLTNNEAFAQDSAVFFDVVGLFLVVYPYRVGVVINLITVAMIYMFLVRRYVVQLGRPLYLLTRVASLIGCFISILITLMIVASFVTFVLRRPLSWYALNFNLVGLYVFPMSSAFFIYWYLYSKHSSTQMELPCKYSVFDTSFDAVLMLLSTILLFCSFTGLGSVFIFCIFSLFPFLGRACFYFLMKLKRSSSFGRRREQILLLVLTMGFPSILVLYHAHTSINVFIPILGRSFSLAVPDIFICLIVFVASALPLMYLSSWARCTKPACLLKIGKVFLHCTIAWLLLVAVSRYGNSYSESDALPRKQRGVVVHMNREFRDDPARPDLVTRHDSGIWLISLDYNEIPVDLIESNITDIKCDGPEPYCGIPYLYPVAHAVSRNLLIKSERHKMKPFPLLKVVSKSAVGDFGVNMTFSVEGPPHTHIYISVDDNVELTRWSLGDDGLEGKRPQTRRVPPQAKGSHYFVYYSYGGTKPPSKPLYMWVLFEYVNKVATHDMASFRVALGGHYLFGQGTGSKVLREFSKKMRNDQTFLQWTSSYAMWTFDVKKERSSLA